MAIYYILLALALILSCTFVCVQNEKQPLLSFFLKGLASISVVALGIVASIKSNLILQTEGVLFVVGLLFCLFGDVILELLEFKDKDKKYNIINYGASSFFIAQVLFVLAMCFLVNQNTLAISLSSLFGILMVGIIYLMQKPMKLDYNKSTSTILIYTFGLSTSLAMSFANMIISSFTLSSIILFVGLLLFFLSDLVLSLIYFKENSPRKLYYYNLSLYYLAIICIAGSFVIF